MGEKRDTAVLAALQYHGRYNSTYHVVNIYKYRYGSKHEHGTRVVGLNDYLELRAWKRIRTDSKNSWVKLPKRMARLMALKCFPEFNLFEVKNGTDQ